MLKSVCVCSDGGSLSEGQNSTVWNSTYPAQTSSCLHPVTASVHPDFSPSPVSFSHPEGALWAGHMLSQASLPPPATLADSWTYSLNPQSMSGYPNVHDIYHPHPHAHIHSRHHHPVLHSYPSHSPALDPRFNPLLLPGVRNQNQPAANTGSSPNSEGVKTEIDPSSSSSSAVATSVTWTPSALHGSLEAYDSGTKHCILKTVQYFTKIIHFIICAVRYNQHIKPSFFLCSSRSDQSKDTSLVLKNTDYQFTPKRTTLWLYQCTAAAPALYCEM